MIEKSLQHRLDSVLTFLEKSAKKTGKLVLSETPVVAREIIVWSAAKGLVIFVPATLASVCFAIVSIHFLMVGQFAQAMIAFGPCLLSGVIAGMNLKWLKALLAPKLFLMEFLRSFIKP